MQIFSLMLLLVCWNKLLKLSSEKVQYLVGGYKGNFARNPSMHKIRYIFFFKVCNKQAIPKVAPGNSQPNIYTWTCLHFSACCLQSMNTLSVWDKWESIFRHRIVRWFESVSAAKPHSSAASAISWNKQPFVKQTWFSKAKSQQSLIQ